MLETLNFGNMNIVIYSLKMYCIISFTYYVALKMIDQKVEEKHKNILVYLSMIIVSILCSIINYQTNSFSTIIFLILVLSIIFSKMVKKDIGYSIIVIAFSLSINHILFFISTMIAFLPNTIIGIQNDYISFTFIIIIYIVFNYKIFRINKFKYGFSFLKNNIKNEYINIFILNISTIIIFSSIILANYSDKITGKLIAGVIFFSIIVFITIQKSLQLYYKQKLLIQELNETKEELEKKKQEVDELEKENLNFSKKSHSIAHRQKSLEHKINKLILKGEMASEIDLKDRLDNIAKELQQDIIEALAKTNIPEIDDMLSYMQSECRKDNIDFQIQLSGDIQYMINNHIPKDKLEILLADHIKNAIIAIRCFNNSNKSILVRLGIIEGIYSLYIYDSGMEFEIETLANLSKKPSTTHADIGGTGIGVMNTFDTLRQYEASMIIYEYGKPCLENFTKVIQIKFDKKNEFKICSYRAEEIQSKVDKKNFQLEEIQK